MSSDTIPVLFDTDIGGDIDDALALAYLLTQPRCDLVGVTTVSGEAVARAQLVDAVCRMFGRSDVPIFPGASKPLLGQHVSEVQQKSVLAKYPHRTDFAPNAAVDFLRQTIRARPGEMTLLCVGPFTNAALLFALDPEIPALLRQFVLMGGVYASRPERYGLREWNAMLDPCATAIVMAARVSGTRCIGLDVTCRCRMSRDECSRRLHRGPLTIIADMAEVWFERQPDITFHDPLAAVTIFEPDLCAYRPGLVEVELQSDRLTGLTYFDPGADDKPHHVAVDVQPEAFFEHYFATVERVI